MTFNGALVNEQDVTFAIVVVEESVFNHTNHHIEKVRSSFTPYFPNVPIILMAHNSHGRPMYHGRTDMVVFLVGMDFRRISWKRYGAVEPAHSL
ncbi:hypothetical protein ACFOU2_20290 [Bacillus songklensis]|uniref:Uncharacterized protein n=1 Tax=Bacillus songklensis TaxID=1069116 RepID=A0ABV8B876_9BACI